MIVKKIISISVGLFSYIVISNIFHILFRGKYDIASGILYLYNDMLYIVGFIMTFLTYGYGKVNKILYVIFSIVFLLVYIYSWLIVVDMPYEKFLYIGLGLLVYICEVGVYKSCLPNKL